MKKLRFVLGLLCVALPVAGAAREPKVKRLTDVVYGHCDGAALVMDVLVPEKQSGVAVFRVVSGGWASSPASAFTEDDWSEFTRLGQTVFLVSHGSQPGYRAPEIAGQLERAIRFVRFHAARFGVDPDRFGVTGTSSGGHLSLWLAVHGSDATDQGQWRERHPGFPADRPVDPVDLVSSRVQAVACFFPPANLVDYNAPDSTFADFQITRLFLRAFFPEGTPREEQVAILAECSPYNYVSPRTPPTLIFQGTADLIVPWRQAVMMGDKLREHGVPCEVVIKQGCAHGWPRDPKEERQMARWFDRYARRLPKSDRCG